MIGWVIVECDVARRVVKVDCGDYEMADWDGIGGFRDEREEGDEVIIAVMGLVIADYTRFVWRLWWGIRGRHGGIRRLEMIKI